MFAFTLHSDGSEILGACQEDLKDCKVVLYLPQAESAEGKELTLRMDSSWAVVLCSRDDLIYRRVNVFGTCSGSSQHFLK